MAPPDEAPIAWPDHPLAASGGEILATRILPLMGHTARDFARAAAVCRGWRAACRAATAGTNLYRELALPAAAAVSPDTESSLKWSPCGNFIAAATCRPYRISIWRASTGALVSEWVLAAPHSPHFGCISVAFSRDSMRVLTLFRSTDHFAIWGVLDGQLLALNRGKIQCRDYVRADFGVPGSASDGLIGFGSGRSAIDLWDVSQPSPGAHHQPRLRSHVGLCESIDVGFYAPAADFAFSPNGSKFVAAHLGAAIYVYDVASLTRLGAYTSPCHWELARAAWTPNGQHVLVSWETSVCVWDFSLSQAPPTLTTCDVADACGSAHFSLCGWSPGGATYFLVRVSEVVGPSYVMEERRASDGAMLRTVNLGATNSGRGYFPYVFRSPDARALLLFPFQGAPARVVVFD